MNDLREAIGVAIFGTFWSTVKNGLEAEAVDRVLDAFEAALPEEYEISLDSEEFWLDGFNAAINKVKHLIHQAKEKS